MKPSRSHTKSERNVRFCHAPTVYLADKTAENMAVLNIDYIEWTKTVLGAINSNLTFIFDLNYSL